MLLGYYSDSHQAKVINAIKIMIDCLKLGVVFLSLDQSYVTTVDHIHKYRKSIVTRFKISKNCSKINFKFVNCKKIISKWKPVSVFFY